MPLSLKKGSRVAWKDETYEILNPTGPGTVLARNVETGKTDVLPVSGLSAPKTEESAEKTPQRGDKRRPLENSKGKIRRN